jgi:hypothetical protein
MTASPKKILQIPFNSLTGDMMHFAHDRTERINGEWVNISPWWRDAHIFEDTLKYDGYLGGRSSMTMMFVSLRHGVRYPMFFRYFDLFIRRPDLAIGPSKTWKWGFAKQGRNYSIVPQEKW